MIRTVGLVAKYQERKAAQMVRWLIPWLKKRGKKVCVENGLARAGAQSCSKKEMALKADLIISLGGDGTLLNIAPLVERPEVPILGVNLGALGFITEVAVDELEPVLSKTLSGDYEVEKRIVLAPICPHTLTHRPIVVPSNAVIRVTLRSFGDTVILIPDGQQGMRLNNGDRVEARDYGLPVSLIKLPSRSYYEILREKLKWGER
jgi:NAD kinase